MKITKITIYEIFSQKRLLTVRWLRCWTWTCNVRHWLSSSWFKPSRFIFVHVTSSARNIWFGIFSSHFSRNLCIKRILRPGSFNLYYGLGNTIVTDQANFIVLVVLNYEIKNKDVFLTFSIFRSISVVVSFFVVFL